MSCSFRKVNDLEWIRCILIHRIKSLHISNCHIMVKNIYFCFVKSERNKREFVFFIIQYRFSLQFPNTWRKGMTFFLYKIRLCLISERCTIFRFFSIPQGNILVCHVNEERPIVHVQQKWSIISYFFMEQDFFHWHMVG